VTTAAGYQHQPVLLEEAVSALNIQQDGIYVDATFGRGGHSRAILKRLGNKGSVLAMDRDPMAEEVAQQLADEDRRFHFTRGPFSMLDRLGETRGVTGKVNGVLLDLGVSSPQLDDANRGFSFMRQGPLDMRMDPASGQSAAAWLNQADEKSISQVLKEYGEERHARRIARAIVESRAIAPITTTTQLADIVEQACPGYQDDKHPATRTFQAIRIFINRELEELAAALPRAVDLLAAGGRLVVISFHSLEDRLVKRFLRQQAKGDDFPPDLPVTQDQLQPRLKLVGRDVRAGEAELAANPRARSAVMRVGEKLA
jgi:16S rRNA (cytosine1402-N4)-methyltransferase